MEAVNESSNVTLTCPVCDVTVNQPQGTRRTICPYCGNFYDTNAASNPRLLGSRPQPPPPPVTTRRVSDVSKNQNQENGHLPSLRDDKEVEPMTMPMAMAMSVCFLAIVRVYSIVWLCCCYDPFQQPFRFRNGNFATSMVLSRQGHLASWLYPLADLYITISTSFTRSLTCILASEARRLLYEYLNHKPSKTIQICIALVTALLSVMNVCFHFVLKFMFLYIYGS